MKNKEPKNNFKKYQANKVSTRLDIIEKCLLKLKKSKIKFKNITELASNVAVFISKEEKTSCNKATLIRNKEYKKILQDYLDIGRTNQLGALIDLTTQLSISNSEKENMRLKQYIIQLEVKLNSPPILPNNKAENYLNNTDIQLAETTQALTLLIKHFDGLVGFSSQGELVDLTRKVNNIIVNKKIIACYNLNKEKNDTL